jgi:hypothetical protein
VLPYPNGYLPASIRLDCRLVISEEKSFIILATGGQLTIRIGTLDICSNLDLLLTLCRISLDQHPPLFLQIQVSELPQEPTQVGQLQGGLLLPVL